MDTEQDTTITEEQNTPFMQRVLDNIFLLLVLGTVIYFISYFFWGVAEIGSCPPIPDEIKENLLNS